MKILPKNFYQRDTAAVAKELLGKTLHFGDKQARIIEVEAYLGSKDPASHKKVFSGPAGMAYIYLLHGMNWCFNVTTGSKSNVGCVLISGIGEIFGPGRVTKLFGITGEHDGFDLTSGPIYISDDGNKGFTVTTGPRIGITKGIDKPLRFVLVDKV